MTKNKIVILFFTCILVTFPLEGAEKSDRNSTATDRPNILLILADDLGIEGIGAYGSDSFNTPNIDRLVKEGMIFTRAFSNPYCTPSRSELLTGRYPFSTNTSRVIWDYESHHDMVLDVSEPSFARQLQQAGYKTAIAGKWQLSFLAYQDWVHDFGFDTYMLWQIIGEEGQRTTRFHEPYFRKDGRVIFEEIKNRYGPDAMVDFLIDFMEEYHDDGPFLAYYTSLLPHFPWVPTPDSDDQVIPEHDGEGNFIGDPKFFPDMVHRLDYNTGRLLDALDKMEIAGNTIVIFLSDNGTDQRLNASINGRKVPGGKATLTDRGTLVPMLIRWPDKIKPGSIDNELVEFADFFPTLIELAGAEMPSEEIHGKSFADRLGNSGSSSGKPWVHIQRADDRYLRTKKWIARNDGLFQEIRPYPVDPEEIEIESMHDEDQKMLLELKKVLDELVLSPD